MLTYDCDIYKNTKCNKRYCNKKFCTKTTKYRYAKRSLKNYIRKILNKIRGCYVY